MTFLSTVRKKIRPGCVVKTMKTGECALTMKDVHCDRIIVDLDREGSPLGPDDRRCDYLFFGEGQWNRKVVDRKAEGVWVAPVEFKSNPPEAGKVAGQLQAGAQAANELVPHKAVVRLVPVAVAKRWHRAVRKELMHQIVTLRGERRRVKLQTCGSSLADALGAWNATPDDPTSASSR